MSQPTSRPLLLALSVGLLTGASVGAGIVRLMTTTTSLAVDQARTQGGPAGGGALHVRPDTSLAQDSVLGARISELEDLLARARGSARESIPSSSEVVDEAQAPSEEPSHSALSQQLHDLIDRGLLNGAASNNNRAIAWQATTALREQGRFADALEVGLLLGNDSSYMLQRIGSDALEAGDEVTASTAFESALRLDILNVRALDGLIEADPSTAVKVFEDSLAWQTPPGNPLVLRNLARAMGAKGDIDGARAVIASLQEQGFDDSEVAKAWKEVDSEEYERVLREELERDATGWGRKQLASFLSEAGETEEAKELYRGMLGDEPGDVEVFKELFQLDPLEAEGLMRSHIALTPNDSWKRIELALKLDEIGRKADAIDLMLQDFPIRPWGRGYNYLLEHAPERAVMALEADLDKTDGQAVGTYANVLWRTGRTEEAVRQWNQAWKLEPYDEEWYCRLNAAAAGRDPFE